MSYTGREHSLGCFYPKISVSNANTTLDNSSSRIKCNATQCSLTVELHVSLRFSFLVSYFTLTSCPNYIKALTQSRKHLVQLPNSQERQPNDPNNNT